MKNIIYFLLFVGDANNHHQAEDHIEDENEVATFSSEGVSNMDSELNRVTAVAQDKVRNIISASKLVTECNIDKNISSLFKSFSFCPCD